MQGLDQKESENYSTEPEQLENESSLLMKLTLLEELEAKVTLAKNSTTL